jgi:hypothetical protein
MLPGAFHLWEFVEFLYYLREVGYTDDWYAYDVMSKEFDTAETFSTVTFLTRRLEALAERVDRQRIAEIQAARNPNQALRYLYEQVVP